MIWKEMGIMRKLLINNGQAKNIAIMSFLAQSEDESGQQSVVGEEQTCHIPRGT